MDFSGATKPLIALMLQQLALENPTQVNPPVSQWTVLGKADSQRPTYGGFFGYNSQWDNVVIGFDFQFNSSKFAADAPSTPIARVVSAGGNAYDVTVTGAASMKIDDYGSLRTRAGYVMNNVMPYVAFGVAFGLADVMRSATVTGMENPSSPPDPTTCGTASAPNCVPFAFTKTESKKNALIWGWSAGAGLDFLVLPNVFVRAEYEYTSFASLYGIKATINSGRIGAGYRF
jgi:opacity protein-like surface antigen